MVKYEGARACIENYTKILDAHFLEHYARIDISLSTSIARYTQYCIENGLALGKEVLYLE
jgi:hypothetical protein